MCEYVNIITTIICWHHSYQHNINRQNLCIWNKI